MLTGLMDDAALTIEVAEALRVARLVVVATSSCAEAGVALNERQQVALVTAALLEFDGFSARAKTLIEVDRFLAELGANGAGTPRPER